MPPKKEAKEIDVAKGFVELEEIANWFESGEPNIDIGVEKFERAMAVADALKARLMAAENKIKDIKRSYKME